MNNNWQDKYLAVLQDLTDKEREWLKIEELLRKTVRRLSIAGLGRDDKVDEILNSIRTAVRYRGDEAQLSSRLDVLSRELAKSVGNNDAGDIASVTTNDGSASPAFCDVLDSLLSRLTLDEVVSNDAKQLQKQLEVGGYQKKEKELISQIADIINRNRSHLLQEKKELEEFIGHIAEILSEVSRSVDAEIKNEAQCHENNVNLQNAMDDEVKRIETDVNNSSGIGDLKKKVVKRIRVIQTQVDFFRQAEEKRNAIAEQQAKTLAVKLTEVESETIELKDKLHKSRKKLLFDTLTGVHSRLAYEERLAEEFKRWKRFDHPLTLGVWDVDHFKKVNDEFGHLAGDKALKIIAMVLKSRIRETDFIGRLGGEEFVSLFPSTYIGDAMRLSDEIRLAVPAKGFNYNGKALKITISCGLSEFREGDDPQMVFKRADEALYAAKNSGRNRCVIN